MGIMVGNGLKLSKIQTILNLSEIFFYFCKQSIEYNNKTKFITPLLTSHIRDYNNQTSLTEGLFRILSSTYIFKKIYLFEQNIIFLNNKSILSEIFT